MKLQGFFYFYTCTGNYFTAKPRHYMALKHYIQQVLPDLFSVLYTSTCSRCYFHVVVKMSFLMFYFFCYLFL